MKITPVTCGSRGDVQPMLPLALKGAGHEAKLIAPPENAGCVGLNALRPALLKT